MSGAFKFKAWVLVSRAVGCVLLMRFHDWRNDRNQAAASRHNRASWQWADTGSRLADRADRADLAAERKA